MEIVEQQNDNNNPMEEEARHNGRDDEKNQEQMTKTNNRPSKCNDDKQQQLLRDFEKAIKATNRAHTHLQYIIEQLYKEMYVADNHHINGNHNGKSNNRYVERSCHFRNRDKYNAKCNCVSDSNTSDSELNYSYWEHNPRRMRWKCHRHGRHLNSRHHHRSHSRN